MDSEHGTLSAATVKTVSLTALDAFNIVVHMVSGTGPMYYTIDGSTPTVAGDATFVVYASLPARAHSLGRESDAQTVKIISATTDGYAVEAF
jgi:hypothetical protein